MPYVVVALIVFVLFYMAGRTVRAALRVAGNRTQRDPLLARLLGSLGSAVTSVLGLLVAAVIVFPAFRPGDLVAGVGITSIALGFAFKDILQNWLAGVSDAAGWPGRSASSATSTCSRRSRYFMEAIMRFKVLNEHDERTFAVIFDIGDEVMSGLQRFAEENNLSASRFTAIGAFETAVLGYFDWGKKDYERIPVNEQCEVLALVGDVALDAGKPKIHAHVVIGLRTGETRGGHLLEARVRPTLEVILTESPGYLKREHDARSGLNLIRIGE